MNTLRRHKHAVLLVFLIVAAVVESFPHRRVLGPIASDLAISITLLLVLLILVERKANRAVAFGALASAVAVNWAHYGLPLSYHPALQLIYHSALLLFCGFATCVILRNILEQHVVRSDDVIGALCGYLVAAAAWSNFFTLETVAPGSFSVGPGFRAGLDTWHGRIAVLNYVSLGSLTSVGSGDVVPVLAPATVLTTLEVVFGQFYIAIVVAQLVGARLTQKLQPNSSPRA